MRDLLGLFVSAVLVAELTNELSASPLQQIPSYEKLQDMLATRESPLRRPMTVTRLDRDYSYLKPSELVARHMQGILNHIGKMKSTVHPRIRFLYELLMKDIHYRGPHGTRYAQTHHASELLGQDTRKPQYDVNKLNRIYTTEADG